MVKMSQKNNQSHEFIFEHKINRKENSSNYQVKSIGKEKKKLFGCE